jgi:hypothetical protein
VNAAGPAEASPAPLQILWHDPVFKVVIQPGMRRHHFLRAIESLAEAFLMR